MAPPAVFNEVTMRKIEMNTVTIGETEYPIYCDLYVMDQIQQTMSINEYQRGILGAVPIYDREGNPMHDENGYLRLKFERYNLNAMLLGLTAMINEGLQIQYEQDGTEFEPVTEKDIARHCTISLADLSVILNDEFQRAIGIKKKDTVKPTKSPATTMKTTRRKKSNSTSTSTAST